MDLFRWVFHQARKCPRRYSTYQNHDSSWQSATEIIVALENEIDLLGPSAELMQEVTQRNPLSLCEKLLSFRSRDHLFFFVSFAAVPQIFLHSLLLFVCPFFLLFCGTASCNMIGTTLSNYLDRFPFFLQFSNGQLMCVCMCVCV